MARTPERDHDDTDDAGRAGRDAARVREADRDEIDASMMTTETAEALFADGVDDGVDQESDDPPLTRTPQVPINKTAPAVATELIALIEQGFSTREAATKVGVHLRTAHRLAVRYSADADAIQAATRKIMVVEALDRLDDWRLAAAVGASKRGNHLPAKDWLLHAGIIEPLQGENQAGIRIAINIGTEERPMKIVSPLESDTDV